jgi:hypothetical protein
VVVILLLFLLAVAPGDYLLLGRLNCRKYTWWLFVMVSASFTFCTVQVAERYMGHVDYRIGLTFVDLEPTRNASGPVVRPARSSRFELLFVATQQAIEIPLRNCLYADLTDRRGPQEEAQFRRIRFAQFDDTVLDEVEAVATDLPLYDGAIPAAFKVRQQLRQWSPRITLRTTFGDDPTVLTATQIDWNSLAGARLHSADGRRALFDAVLEREPEAQVLLLNQKRAFGPTLNPQGVPLGVSQSVASSSVRGAFSWPPGTSGTTVSIPELQSASPVLLLAANASIRPSAGLFAIVSQISPTGNENLEDLTILDETDPQQWLLIAGVRRGSDWIVYRLLLQSASIAGRS